MWNWLKRKYLARGSKSPGPKAGQTSGPGRAPGHRKHFARTIRESLDFMDQFLGRDSEGFRNLSTGPRDLSRETWETLLARNENLATFHPVARRAMTIRTDLVTSGGIQPVAVHPDKKVRELVQAELDRHWTLNDWAGQYRNRVWNLGVHGELIRIRRPRHMLPEVDGRKYNPGEFRAGTFHPVDIQAVVRDPWDMEKFTALYLSPHLGPGDDRGKSPDQATTVPLDPGPQIGLTNPGMKLTIAHRVRTGPGAGRIVGDVFFLPLNQVLGMTRGLGDLTPVQEWLDMYQTTLLSGVERAQISLSYIWHVVKSGATEEDIIQRATELARDGITPGSIQVTDEREEWHAVSPDLAGGDFQIMTDVLFNLCWGGLGLPVHWYTASETVNRASGENMDDPVYMWSRARRAEVEEVIALELELALQDSLFYGRLQGATDSAGDPITMDDLSFSLVSVDPDPTRFELAGKLIQQITDALVAAVSAGLVSFSDAQFIFRQALDQAGVQLPDENVDPEYNADGTPPGIDAGPLGETAQIGDPARTVSLLRSEELRALRHLERRKDELDDYPLARTERVWVAGQGVIA